jgi:hypothetical protein
VGTEVGLTVTALATEEAVRLSLEGKSSTDVVVVVVLFLPVNEGNLSFQKEILELELQLRGEF